MIVNFWPQWFRALLSNDGQWPKSYCAVDIETTGFSHSEDVVTEWGHCLVEDGKIVDRLSLLIDGSDRTTPPDWWVQQKLRQVKQSMALNGKTYHISYDMMRTDGMKPEKAFAFIEKFTATVRDKGIPFVLHNGFFDEKMLSVNFLQFKFGAGYSFGDRMIDTAGIAKASQLLDNSRMHPRKSDTLRDYFTRVRYTRVAGVKSSMDEYCLDKYQLCEKYGFDRNSLHGAKEDSYCCHLLMQEFSTLITDPVDPPVYPTEDSKSARKPLKNVTPPVQIMPGLKRIRGVRRA